MKKLTVLMLFLFSVISTNALATQTKRYDFKVFLGEKEIGHHKFLVTPHKQQTYVSSEANFDVKFLFFSAYNYLHYNSEVWQDNCLQAINAVTDDNGDMLFVRGNMANNGMQLHTHTGSQQLNGCVKTFAYWDPSLLDAKKLLNVQTGQLEDVDIKLIGQSTRLVRGKPLKTNHYRIKSEKFSIDLWYSSNHEWLALESTTENGARLRYLAQ